MELGGHKILAGYQGRRKEVGTLQPCVKQGRRGRAGGEPSPKAWPLKLPSLFAVAFPCSSDGANSVKRLKLDSDPDLDKAPGASDGVEKAEGLREGSFSLFRLPLPSHKRGSGGEW